MARQGTHPTGSENLEDVMARNTALPMPRSSALPKAVGTMVMLALLVVIVKHPTDAAEWAKALGAWIGNAADGIATFMQQVIG
jgi:hypothetical protein